MFRCKTLYGYTKCNYFADFGSPTYIINYPIFKHMKVITVHKEILKTVCCGDICVQLKVTELSNNQIAVFITNEKDNLDFKFYHNALTQNRLKLWKKVIKILGKSMEEIEKEYKKRLPEGDEIDIVFNY